VLSSEEARFERWLRSNVRAQKQAGFAIATVRLILGDVTGGQLRVLADLARAFGDGTVRLAPDQNLALRWVPQTALPALHRQLVAAGLGRPDAGSAADVTSCPGAETCRLAVTQSRGLGSVLGEFLRSRPDLVEAVPELAIKISGCPNGCGQHHIAGIGFQGSLRKVDKRAVPQYFVMLGGDATGETTSFARLVAKLPARRATTALERLIDLYRAEGRDGETPTAYFSRVTLEEARAVLADLEELTPESARPEDFVDLGEDKQFEHVVMDGECSA
jgi:sulfite reductase (NADPH) hemoprotein beta-component